MKKPSWLIGISENNSTFREDDLEMNGSKQKFANDLYLGIDEGLRYLPKVF